MIHMKNYKIAVLKGDGIGPEIVDEAIKVLDLTAEKCGFTVESIHIFRMTLIPVFSITAYSIPRVLTLSS